MLEWILVLLANVELVVHVAIPGILAAAAPRRRPVPECGSRVRLRSIPLTILPVLLMLLLLGCHAHPPSRKPIRASLARCPTVADDSPAGPGRAL